MQCRHCGKETATEQEIDLELRKCVSAWQNALVRHNAERQVFKYEVKQIKQAIEFWDSESVYLALLGAGYEPSSATYAASDYFSLRRTLDAQKFDRFVNLGAKARYRQEMKIKANKRLELIAKGMEDNKDDIIPIESAEKIKERMASVIGKLRG